MVVFLLMVNSLLHRQLICARVNEHYYRGTTISASTSVAQTIKPNIYT